MRTFLNKIGALLLAALLATAALPGGAHAAAKSRKEKKKSEAPAPEKKLSAYEKLFKDKESRTAEGLFKLHIIDGKLYTEIPLDILEREFVINTTIEASSLADYGLAGQQPLPPYHITFSRRDSLVRMHEVPRRTLSDSDAGIARALELSSAMPIVASYPIKAYNADSTAVVIENTALFMSDNEHLKAFEARGMSPLHISRASYKADRSLLRDVEGGKDYASVISDMTYGVTTQYFIFIICKDKPFTARARRTVTILPEECAPARIADPRIGVLPVPFTRFTAEQGTRPAYFASRINFRPGGEIRPVTFYIDTLFTPAWQRGIRRGIALWNEAFRRIGMGDVLKAEVYPAEGFDSNSPGRFYVKYVASTNPKMTVNLATDPRSGEITGGCIHLPESLLDEIRLRRFIDLSAADPAARDMMLDDEELALAMKEKGLGTPATRAQIIETLIAHKFVERDRRDLVPTARAESLIKFLNVLSIDSLTSPAMTGEWEQKLRLIERSELSRGAFMNGIGAMTTDIVEKARSFTEDGIENKETDIPNPIDGGNLIETFRAYKSKDGKFTIYKTIGNRKMTEDEVRELVTKGSVGPLDGFRSKLGKPFSATLKLDENFALKFHFGDGQDSSDRKPENLAEAPVVAKCPRSAMGLCSCKDGVTDTAYVCRSDSSPEKKCSFRLGKNMLSHVITITELESLATTGKTPVIDDFVSKRTKKKFSAALALDQKGGISFEFAKKIRKGGQ